MAMTPYLVFIKRTNIQICECSTRDDAKMMLHFDPVNREVRQRRLPVLTGKTNT